MSANKWLKILQDKRLSNEDDVPSGYITRSQLEKIWKVGKAESLNRIRHLKRAGLIEEKKFRIKTESRGVFPTAHYKIK